MLQIRPVQDRTQRPNRSQRGSCWSVVVPTVKRTESQVRGRGGGV